MSIQNSKKAIYLPLVLTVILILGVYLGMRLASVSSIGNSAFFIQPDKYNKVNDIINYIEQDYVDSVNRKDLENDAIEGILDQLDPHSHYIQAEEFHTVNDPLTGNFEGIGIQFRIEKDTIMVIRTISGGPSEKVGLQAGDRIVKINDTVVAGVGTSNDEAIGMLKGPRGTRVDVDIHRKHNPELIEFTIIRDVIRTYSIDISYMIDDEVGYIKVSEFSETMHDDFIAAMKQLKEEGMEKLILDLRGNYGGYLQSAIEMADEFLREETLIVYTEGNNRPNSYAFATRKGLLEDDDLVILIDEGSASASEIVAGAIQDNDRGLIIGRRSFGKGLVQEQLNLPDGSALRLTVSRYHTPTGRNIQRPYNNGSDEYYEDFYHRFVNGEMENPDSIHFDDSLKYYTPKGKVVYGGGGIMPDIYVPLKSEEADKYYNQLLHKNFIFQFAFDYTDNHREELSRFDTFNKFNSNFIVSDKLFDELVSWAASQGIKAKRKEIRDSEDKVKILLKAYIGRNMLDDPGFYPIYHKIDKIFQIGYKEITK